MSYKVDLIGDEESGFATVRVDVWSGNGRHWIAYFRKDEDGKLNLDTKAETPERSKEDVSNSDVSDRMEEALRHHEFELAE